MAQLKLSQICKKAMYRAFTTLSVLDEQVKRLPKCLQAEFSLMEYYFVLETVRADDAFATIVAEYVAVFNTLNGYDLGTMMSRYAILNTKRNDSWYYLNYALLESEMPVNSSFHCVSIYVNHFLHFLDEVELGSICVKCARQLVNKNAHGYTFVEIRHERFDKTDFFWNDTIHMYITRHYNWCANCRTQPLFQFLTVRECRKTYHICPAIFDADFDGYSLTRVPLSDYSGLEKYVRPNTYPKVSSYGEYSTALEQRRARNFRRRPIRV